MTHTYTHKYIYTPHSAYLASDFYLFIFRLLPIDSCSAQNIPFKSFILPSITPKPTRDSHYASKVLLFKLYMSKTFPHDLCPFSTGQYYVTGDSSSTTTPKDPNWHDHYWQWVYYCREYSYLKLHWGSDKAVDTRPPQKIRQFYQYCSVTWFIHGPHFLTLLPARASEQGNVIGSVRIYIYICAYKKKL